VADGFVLVSWFACLIAAPVVLREVNAQRMGRLVLTKNIVDLAISSGVATVLNLRPSASGYFAAYMISQCVTTVCCGLALKNRVLVGTSVGAAAVGTSLLLAGW
jgi:hypothetical protein